MAKLLNEGLRSGWPRYGMEKIMSDKTAIIVAEDNADGRTVVQHVESMGEVSDGYHTFNELYDFRKAYNALLFNEYAKQRKYSVYKSKLHSDGELPFGGGWFVVGCQLSTGQITNHYELKDWDLFIVPEVARASVWDGHTAQEALQRLLAELRDGGGK
jgi:hypothetical protein